MKLLKDYWFLVVFILGITGSAYTLKAQQTNTTEVVKEVKEKVNENEKVDLNQTITLEKLSIVQEQLVKTLDKLNEKMDKKRK